MTVAAFISKYRQNNPNGHFFDKETLRFFGENISEMSYNGLTEITDYRGRRRDVHELRVIQHEPVFGKRWKLHYFDIQTYDQVFPDESVVDEGDWVKMRK